MSSVNDIVERIRSVDLERTLGLRPAWPGLAAALDGRQIALVRVKTARRGPATLEGYQVRELEQPIAPATIFDQNGQPGEQLATVLRESIEAVGGRPGRVSLVLPDNLAKISLLHIPERPPSHKQLLEIIRFKMHRSVPFRFSEAALTFQIIPLAGAGIAVLVALMRQSLVDRYEEALRSIGARPGLIDLCTPNLLDLCREKIDEAGSDGDVAVLNCTTTYFSLIIVRARRLIFFRCKNYRLGQDQGDVLQGMLKREVANSISYYEEKLGGEKISTVFVRSVDSPYEEVVGVLHELGVDRVEPIDPIYKMKLGEGASLDPREAQLIAPAVGAAVGRNSARMQPLDLNLATHPFRNNTLPWIGLIVAVLLLGSCASIWNVQTYRRNATWIADLEGKSAAAREQLERLDHRERKAQNQIEKVPLDVLAVKAGKANEVIRWKAFSWTQLFNKLQEVMPNDAQMASVRPVFRPDQVQSRGRQTEVDGRVRVSVEGRARTMSAFFELERNLLRHPQFDRVDPEGTETEKNTGNVVFRLRFLYDPTPPPPEPAQPEAEVALADGEEAGRSEDPKDAEDAVTAEASPVVDVEPGGEAQPDDGTAVLDTAAGAVEGERPATADDVASTLPAPDQDKPRKRGGRRGKKKGEGNP